MDRGTEAEVMIERMEQLALKARDADAAAN